MHSRASSEVEQTCLAIRKQAFIYLFICFLFTTVNEIFRNTLQNKKYWGYISSAHFLALSKLQSKIPLLKARLHTRVHLQPGVWQLIKERLEKLHCLLSKQANLQLDILAVSYADDFLLIQYFWINTRNGCAIINRILILGARSWFNLFYLLTSTATLKNMQLFM